MPIAKFLSALHSNYSCAYSSHVRQSGGGCLPDSDQIRSLPATPRPFRQKSWAGNAEELSFSLG